MYYDSIPLLSALSIVAVLFGKNRKHQLPNRTLSSIMTSCITSPLKHFEEGKWPVWAADEGEREKGSPSSSRKSLLNRKPLGSFPMKLCTYSVP